MPPTKTRCQICYTKFPILLPLMCSHELCMDCLGKIISKSCPFCRNPDSSVDGDLLKTNVLLYLSSITNQELLKYTDCVSPIIRKYLNNLDIKKFYPILNSPYLFQLFNTPHTKHIEPIDNVTFNTSYRYKTVTSDQIKGVVKILADIGINPSPPIPGTRIVSIDLLHTTVESEDNGKMNIIQYLLQIGEKIKPKFFLEDWAQIEIAKCIIAYNHCVTNNFSDMYDIYLNTRFPLEQIVEAISLLPLMEKPIDWHSVECAIIKLIQAKGPIQFDALVIIVNTNACKYHSAETIENIVGNLIERGYLIVDDEGLKYCH